MIPTIEMAPIGKPIRRGVEPAPIEIPETWPTTVPVEPVKVPA